MYSKTEVRRTTEFIRVENLPRRTWDEASATELAARLRPYLATPQGTMNLRPIQAQALYEAGTYGGAFLPIRVGGGKTLLSLLLPYVMQLERPILLIPAALKEKTERARDKLSQHWRIPVAKLRIESYEQLSHPSSQHMLDFYRPDGIITDESHKLKNPTAAVSKRVARYMRFYPATKFVAMSGTITKRSLRDYAHLVAWALKDNTPLPFPYNELQEWALALDETKDFQRLHPGALMSFALPEDETEDDTCTARKGMRRRLTETPGVVTTTEAFSGCPIYISTVIVEKTTPTLEGYISKLREVAETPDGWPLSDAMSLWRHAREISLGFYYRWNPRPPPEWLYARKAWCASIRKILKTNRRNWDSEFHVSKGVIENNKEYQQEFEEYQVWKKIEPVFEPHTEAVWFDDTVPQMAATWLRKHKHGIVWVQHTTVGEKIAQLSGCPFFSRDGRDALGRTFYDVEENPQGYKGPCVASIQSNATGRNLQWWNQNYVVGLPSSGATCEQLLGRTHRDLQAADEVTFEVLVACIEHYDGILRAVQDARYIEDSTGQSQKLLYADITLPERDLITKLPTKRYQTTRK